MTDFGDFPSSTVTSAKGYSKHLTSLDDGFVSFQQHK